MFENQEVLTGRISKQDFDEQEPQLRVDLLNAQFDLNDADFSVVIVIAGDNRLSSNQLGDRLNEWMDARFIDTNVFLQRTQEEEQRPRAWRYWRVLPADGRMAVYGGAWPLKVIADNLAGNLNKKQFQHRLDQINTFEKLLADDGTLVLKFWCHLPEKEHKKRLKKEKKNPDRNWWVDEQDWEVLDRFRKQPKAAEEMLQQTNTPEAPWFVVDCTDARFRDMTVAGIIRDRVQARLANPPKATTSKKVVQEEYEDALGKADLSAALEKDEYKKQLAKYQKRFHNLMREANAKGVSTVLAFEGWDAGGKGGNIRRLTSALPARSYKVIPIAAPTEEERVRHYLWRFWRHMPRAGTAVIFDRTWYGRVTVERIEGFAKPHEWQRAYDEINDFEEQLAERGMVVLKFWLHISQEEQLARFQAREVTSFKKYKITEEDYRNRARWDDYAVAVNEMIAKTNTRNAPWHVVPANNKYYARIYVLKTVCNALEKALKKAD